jgi:hypothetical protein
MAQDENMQERKIRTYKAVTMAGSLLIWHEDCVLTVNKHDRDATVFKVVSLIIEITNYPRGLNPVLLSSFLILHGTVCYVCTDSTKCTSVFTLPLRVCKRLIEIKRCSTKVACTDDLLSRKPGFLLSALHSRTFCWLSAAPLVFLFLGFLPL